MRRVKFKPHSRKWGYWAIAFLQKVLTFSMNVSGKLQSFTMGSGHSRVSGKTSHIFSGCCMLIPINALDMLLTL